ncbi:hypothetical protein [Paenibacillus terrae]
MTNAWAIALMGVAKFGDSSKQYFI